MAITLDTGSFQTVSGPTTSPSIPDPIKVVWKKDDPNEAIMANSAASLAQPNTLRFALSPVADVFAKTGISPIANQRRDGFSLLAEVNEVWMVNDAANTAFIPYYLPIRAHMVLRLPYDAKVDATSVTALLQRLRGVFQRTDVQTLSQGIAPFLQGVLRT